MAQIEDPRTHSTAYVNDDHRLETSSVSEDVSLAAAFKGQGYNLHTGTVNLTSSTESGVLFFENQEGHDIVIAALAVGIGNGGVPTDKTIITVVRNPTASSFTTVMPIKSNRNHSSTKTLSTSSLAYVGLEGGTFTGGEDSLIFYQGPGRLIAGINLILGVGNTIGVKIDPQVSSGSTNVYASLVIYVRPDISNH